MRVGKTQLGIVAVLIVAGVAAIFLQQRAAEEQRETQQGALMRAEAGKLRADQEALRARQARDSRSIKAPDSGAGVAEKLTGSPAAARPVTADQAKQWLAAANDPPVLAQLAAEARRLTLERFADFFAQLNLSPEQTKALIDLLDDKRQAAVDLAVVSLQGGVDPRSDVEAFQNQVVAAKAAIEEKIRALLGEELYAQYQTYNQEMGVKAAFLRLERVVGGTENALTPDQTAQLQQLLRATPNGVVTPKTISDAQSFLTPAQISALQKAFAAQEAVIQSRLEQSLPPSPRKIPQADSRTTIDERLAIPAA